jgi:tRNA A-37 threonylcarbamoyl transferase component Bud32
VDPLIYGARRIGFAGTTLTADEAVDVTPSDPRVLHPKEIERLLVERVDMCNAAAAPIHVTGPLRSNGFSRIYRGSGGMFPNPVAIKQFLWDPSGASPMESARTYFHGLQKMAEVAARLDLLAIEPYALLESHGIVVATWIEGPTLATAMFRESAAYRQELIRDAGVWLARLHHGGAVERRPPDIAVMLTRLESELSGSSDKVGSLPYRALSLLHAIGRQLASQPVFWSHHYGDFKPANLIVRDGRLVAIDVELLIAAPAVWDAAHFLNHLQLEFYSPRAMPRWREISRLTELFCRGYADAIGEPLPHRLLLWQRLFNVMYLMAQHREWCRSPLAWPVQWRLGHLARTLCDVLAD